MRKLLCLINLHRKSGCCFMLLQCVVSNEVITVRCIFKLLLVFLKIHDFESDRNEIE